MAERSQFRLLTERRFLPFFLVQFLGAGNDNIFKFAFSVLATYSAAEWGGLDPKSAGAVIGGVFIVPFMLLSATAGQIADKYDKAALIRFVKSLEIAIMLVIGVGFIWKVVGLLFAGVFLMGLHSTLFGPVKYAYLPQHLHPTEITGGNGLVGMGTFMAILLGTLVGGALVGLGESGPHWVAALSIALAIAGRVAAGFVPVSPASEPGLTINWNPISETWKNLGHAYENRPLFLSLLGVSWLWFFGSTFITTFTGFARESLGGDYNVVTLLLAVFSVGIGTGALLCERLSGHKVEIGLVPFGSIGMTVFAIDLWLASSDSAPGALVGVGAFLAAPSHWRVIADLFLLAMFAGFYAVPLYAMIQTRCEPARRARVIAANNILNALFMVISALLATALLQQGATLPQLYLVVGLMNVAIAAYIYTLVPEFLARFLAWLLIHSVYRLEKCNLERIPDEGPALIVCNHISFVDPVVIFGACRQPVRFIMDHRIFRTPLLSWLFRTVRAIPIASAKEDPEMMERAFAEADRALKAGEIVVIFPEGSISRSGEIERFRPGVTRLLQGNPVPVIPMALSGLWGSFFSRKDGPAMSKPARFVPFRKIRLSVGESVPAAQATPEALQAMVLALRGDWK